MKEINDKLDQIKAAAFLNEIIEEDSKTIVKLLGTINTRVIVNAKKKGSLQLGQKRGKDLT